MCSSDLVRPAHAHRVDAKREEPIQLLVNCRHSESGIGHQVSIECLEVPEIENQAVALGNRTLDQGGGTEKLEQSIRRFPRRGESCGEYLPPFGMRPCWNHEALYPTLRASPQDAFTRDLAAHPTLYYDRCLHSRSTVVVRGPHCESAGRQEKAS